MLAACFDHASRQRAKSKCSARLRHNDAFPHIAPSVTAATASTPPLRDARVIALVGFAHGTSHFFQLLAPPLFPWLMPEFGLDFTAAGGMMTLFFIISASGQAAAGFLVDRFGAFRVLLAGMFCFLLSGFILAAAQGYAGLMLAAAVAGLGNCVLHPADFTVLNRKVSAARLGHAFSVHGLSGNLGWAAAPVFLTTLASLYGWRVAAMAAGLVALPAMALLWRFRADLADAPAATPRPASPQGTFAFLRSGAVWLCFAFFFLITVAFGAIQNFAAPVLGVLYGLSLPAAAATVSGYMLAAAAGIVVGGFVAQRMAQDRVIATVLAVAALCAVAMATQWVPAWSVPALMAGIGFFSGCAGPSRDLLIRRAAIANFGTAAYGRVYGFVYSGLDLGLATAPLIFGAFMDGGRFALVLVGIAAFQALSILAALRVGRSARS